MVRRAATAALVVLSVSSLGMPAVNAASERTTALVTIAEAHAHCLIETKQMTAPQAQNKVNQYLRKKGVSNADREEVKSTPGYDDLMRSFMDEQGGCEGLVRNPR